MSTASAWRRSLPLLRRTMPGAEPVRRYHRRDPFTDRVKVLISSGTGGDGASIMSHEHSDEFAGPGGGNGGRGGHVFLRTSSTYADLSHIKQMGPQIAACDGTVGFSRISHGRSGADLQLILPVGTQVVDVDTNEVVFDLDEKDVEVLLLEGGQGGKGNAAFANRRHHSPVESTKGLPGNTMLMQMELKSIADCGLVGYPNAGKSSLLNAISSCKPKIAPYPFTTVHPWVGVINDLYGHSCQVADLPGLIEGAYENRGLGHQFLRHVERTKVLCYVLDMCDSYHTSSSRRPPQPWEVLETLQQELEYYMPGLSERGLMVFANKMDVEKDSCGMLLEEKLEELRKRTSLPVFPVSAALGIALGCDNANSGLAPAVRFMCDAVYTRKSQSQMERRQQREMEMNALQQAFQAKHRGVFSPLLSSSSSFSSASSASLRPSPLLSKSLHKESRGSASNRSLTMDSGISAVSLVDQQLDDLCGSSGLGVDFDSYAHLPAEGKLAEQRDVSFRGRYWTLTREDGDKMSNEKW